ncbi:unnamed protein product, partial [Rangifer tarandus platyrhynchus]
WLFVVIGPPPSSAKCHMCSQAGGCGSQGAVRPEQRWEAGARARQSSSGSWSVPSSPDLQPQVGHEDAGEALKTFSAFRKGSIPRLLSPDPPRSGSGCGSPQPASLGSGRWPLSHADAPPGRAGTLQPALHGSRGVCLNAALVLPVTLGALPGAAAPQMNSRALCLPLEAPGGLQPQQDQLPRAPSMPGSEGLCHPPP